MTSDYSAYNPSALPRPVVAYLDARDADSHDLARAQFASDATVLDDGRTFTGIDEITEWLHRTASEYEYTSTRIGQHADDLTHITVLLRLDGNFPGGTVVLRNQFELDGDHITRLAIDV